MNNEQMNASLYRDMHLLDELAQRPGTTQRELAKRIGVALGLTNLMLRRLINKGYVKISGTQRNRLHYLVTPQGILEKSRLTYEFIQHSVQLYTRVRHVLRDQLVVLAQEGNRRILLCGTGELAELAFLTIHEMGLELVGVIDESQDPPLFLGNLVQSLDALRDVPCDRMIIASLPAWQGLVARGLVTGLATERLLFLPLSGLPHALGALAR